MIRWNQWLLGAVIFSAYLFVLWAVHRLAAAPGRDSEDQP